MYRDSVCTVYNVIISFVLLTVCASVGMAVATKRVRFVRVGTSTYYCAPIRTYRRGTNNIRRKLVPKIAARRLPTPGTLHARAILPTHTCTAVAAHVLLYIVCIGFRLPGYGHNYHYRAGIPRCSWWKREIRWRTAPPRMTALCPGNRTRSGVFVRVRRDASERTGETQR